ncbi:DUF4389 domain-containing protein [Marinomonas piezotolerans]|uniref:DUF4389 domain-containing protein n=1 Tax=Marinomonas piezotolerans TaxID=2213058 RepID=A0A370UE20_9GAMM|nr:DUF4389 domain-containing protein [Marinomonas piezotolerans]RDL46032.1 DUF4389 domain-containing protein [Marinomonas piezotolerans]
MGKPGYADQNYWIRILFMLIYWCLLNIALTLFGFLLIIVGVIRLGSKHEPVTLTSWLKSVGMFIKQIMSFLAFTTEEKPFPFQPWPESNDSEK